MKDITYRITYIVFLESIKNLLRVILVRFTFPPALNFYLMAGPLFGGPDMDGGGGKWTEMTIREILKAKYLSTDSGVNNYFFKKRY